MLAALACSGDDGDGLPNQESAETPEAPDGPDDGDGVDSASANGIPPCDDLYADGTPLSEVMAAGGRSDGETILSIDISADTCLDGRELHWNDRGWGFSDGTWASHATGATEPPPRRPVELFEVAPIRSRGGRGRRGGAASSCRR